MRARRPLFVIAALLSLATHAFAAGPRFVAGQQWQNSGQIMNWYRTDVQYFVDAGALSAYVDNTTAVAMVNAAAAVWNVPSVSFTLKNGGALAEDVSSSTVYLGSSGPVWPADVQSTNYTAKQIAVVFDADGTITDMLLGSGASDPSNCRQNAVTESVDLFIQPGKIAHAVLVLNGRCTGPAQEQQLQMRYQLERAFGRVIGLGWSQTNDNVFTYSPAPNAEQQMHWPIMHPIDILCGLYTYQCLPAPFTLRDDDIAAVGMVYDTGNAVPNTLTVWGTVTFPTGEGMNGVNIVSRRGYNWTGYVDQFEEVSSVSGYSSSDAAGNAVTGPSTDTLGVTGIPGSGLGYYSLFGVPSLTQFPYTNLIVTMEPVNPLYTGSYAVGPYRVAAVLPSGLTGTSATYGLGNTTHGYIGVATMSGAASVCNPSADGVEDAPATLAVDGVWSGRICGVGHTAWSSFTPKAGRTATLEVTATDEQSLASGAKAMPVIGLWKASDATGVLPTLAATQTALNSGHIGMTQLNVSFATAETVRMAIADARGDGRPDYTYRGRLLYADTVTPARMPAAGAPVRILGTGFMQGNTVTVGGVGAQVTSITATEIDAIAPSAAALGSTAVNDVVVTDLSTGGSTAIVGGLTYSGASTDALSMAQAPAANVAAGVPMLFTLRVVDANGAAVADASIAVTLAGGGAVFSTCQLATCTLVTDASGVAHAAATASSVSTVLLKASISSGSSISATWSVVQASQAVGFVRPTQYVASGAGAQFTPAVVLAASGVPATGQGVRWTTTSPRIALATAVGLTSASGTASVHATGSLLDGETATVQACAWVSVCATESVLSVTAANLNVLVTAGDGQSISSSATLGVVSARVVDAAGHPVSGAAVVVYQAVTGWQPPCATGGRCAPAPMYGSASTPMTSDDDGNVVVTPLQYANTAAVTKITIVAGTQGVATATLQKTP